MTVGINAFHRPTITGAKHAHMPEYLDYQFPFVLPFIWYSFVFMTIHNTIFLFVYLDFCGHKKNLVYFRLSSESIAMYKSCKLMYSICCQDVCVLFPLSDDLKSFRSTSDRFLRKLCFPSIIEGITRRMTILLYSELTSIRSTSWSFSSKKWAVATPNFTSGKRWFSWPPKLRWVFVRTAGEALPFSRWK